MQRTDKDILIGARKRIENPENWIQGQMYHEGGPET